MIRQGDFSMLKVWAGLEARKFLQASIDDVSAPFFRYRVCEKRWLDAKRS
jgi:hypothetical protein